VKVTFFTKPECSLCDAAWFVVEKVTRGRGVAVERIDISQPGAERWHDLYAEHIPVVHLDGVEVFRHRVDERRLRAMLSRA
jgi:hypothetical protein